MPYVVFGGASDARWGSVLSRYPIAESGVAMLPLGGAPLRRNVTWADIDIGQGRLLHVMAVHLHHVQSEPAAQLRQEQIRALLPLWGNKPRAVILGDFNATPATGEYALLRDAGLQDAWLAAGAPKWAELTYASDGLYERIDYIWLGPGLIARDFATSTSMASDHRGIAVTVEEP
jgi:endonuclease/exonuclease/phosphatase family metal-dependent hydrolase